MDDRRLLATTQSRTIVVVDTASGETSLVYAAPPDMIRGFSLSPSKRELYISRGPEEADIWIATIETQ